MNEQVNGKLPNMDLLNLGVLLVEKAGSVTSINGVLQSRGGDEEGYQKTAKTVLRGILSQVTPQKKAFAHNCFRASTKWSRWRVLLAVTA